jgi:hypothetical protein
MPTQTPLQKAVDFVEHENNYVATISATLTTSNYVFEEDFT